jgi:hypothetical protein
MEDSMRRGTALIVIGFVLAGSGSALAHKADLMNTHRAGPIVRNETTMAELRSWFGPPDDVRSKRVGCVRVTKARWNEGVTVYASRGGATRVVAASFIRQRTVESSQHGDLQMHTKRGLRVPDREGRLRRLYPGADPITHAGHTHYRLGTAPSGAYLMAKVVRNRVVRLENWPFEFC